MFNKLLIKSRPTLDIHNKNKQDVNLTMSIYIKIPPDYKETELLPPTKDVAELKLSNEEALTLRTYQTAFHKQYALIATNPYQMLPTNLYTTTSPIDIESRINAKLKALYEKEHITAEIIK